MVFDEYMHHMKRNYVEQNYAISENRAKEEHFHLMFYFMRIIIAVIMYSESALMNSFNHNCFNKP